MIKKILLIGVVLFFAMLESTQVRALELSDFGFKGGIYAGVGTFSSDKGTPSRSVNSLGAEVLPGYKVAGFLIGPYFNYYTMGQTTDPAEVGNENVKGRGYLLGIGTNYNLDLNFGRLSFTGDLGFFGHHNLTKGYVDGSTVSYQKPFGIVLEAGYTVIPKLTVELRYSHVSYSELDLADVANDISDDKRADSEIGLAISFNY